MDAVVTFSSRSRSTIPACNRRHMSFYPDPCSANGGSLCKVASGSQYRTVCDRSLTDNRCVSREVLCDPTSFMVHISVVCSMPYQSCRRLCFPIPPRSGLTFPPPAARARRCCHPSRWHEQVNKFGVFGGERITTVGKPKELGEVSRDLRTTLRAIDVPKQLIRVLAAGQGMSSLHDIDGVLMSAPTLKSVGLFSREKGFRR